MNDLEKRFAAARRRAIATDYAHLNPRQLEGVLTTEGPLLLLAGFLLMGQRYALLLAAVTALVDALPVFGTGTV